MRHQRIAFAAGLLMVAAAPLQAQDDVDTIPVQGEEEAGTMPGATAMPYTFASAGYVFTDYDDTDVDQNGFGIDGSFLLTESIFVVASVGYAQTDSFDDPINGGSTKLEQTSITLGGGYRFGLTDALDLVGEVRAVQAEQEAFGASEDDTGYSVAVGARMLVLPELEVAGKVSYVDVLDDDSTSFRVSGLYSFIPQLAAGLDLAIDDDGKSAGVTVRYSF